MYLFRVDMNGQVSRLGEFEKWKFEEKDVRDCEEKL
jgi:hypothetical protein